MTIAMLETLSVKNVVLIENLEINFSRGLCALTGETGAGKSVLLDSLGLILGSRGGAGLIRNGASQAVICGAFAVSDNHPSRVLIKELGIECAHDENIIIRRIIYSDGKNKCYINDNPVTTTALKDIGDTLVEINGQFATHGIMNSRNHITMLDEFAGIDNSLSALWHKWKSAEKNLQDAVQKAEKMKAEEEYLRCCVEDLEKLAPQEQEEEYLSSLRQRLMQREKLLENLTGSHHFLSIADENLGTGARHIEKISDLAQESLQPVLEYIERAEIEIREALNAIESLSSETEECEHDLQSIDERLYELRSQARKHGCDVSELPALKERLINDLAMMDSSSSHINDLCIQAKQCEEDYLNTAEEISKKRKSAAKELSKQVNAELAPLKLEKALFVVEIREKNKQDWNEKGIDNVEFLVSTNPNSNPAPLGKIASGGEMARFMLAVKVVTAKTGDADCLIFDEVDSGIGGGTADAVGERLAVLAKDKQILVVTHSPQVASRANEQWLVLKSHSQENDMVTTNVIHLKDTQNRREEIARMLSGKEITDEARMAADKLLSL